MAALTIKFNYVQDYAVIPRKEFIKNVVNMFTDNFDKLQQTARERAK